MRVQDVYEVLQKLAPFETQLDFDNAGLLIGSPDRPVTKIGVVLDVTHSAVDYAVQKGIDCIVSHHPVIFGGLKSISANSVIYRLIQQGISVISAHTNLDCAVGGVNDVLAKVLALQGVTSLGLPGDATPPMGRIGHLQQPMSCGAFAKFVNERLQTRTKYVNTGKLIQTVAVCGGSGGEFLLPAHLAGADALVTADVKHHLWLEAADLGMMLVDAGHYETEQVVVTPLAGQLSDALDVEVVCIPQTSPVQYE